MNCRFLLAGCVLSVSLAAGCGGGNDGRAAVSGGVKLDGAPLPHGSIKFAPQPGVSGVVTAAEINNGRYDIPAAVGAAVGKNRVEITAVRKSGRMLPNPLGPPGSTLEAEESAVASQFNTESTLEFDVKPGTNSADFNVTSP